MVKPHLLQEAQSGPLGGGIRKGLAVKGLATTDPHGITWSPTFPPLVVPPHFSWQTWPLRPWEPPLAADGPAPEIPVMATCWSAGCHRSSGLALSL